MFHGCVFCDSENFHPTIDNKENKIYKSDHDAAVVGLHASRGQG
jgi:hypothetical protein